MSSIQIIALMITGSGLLILALSIPLILRRIPPNAVYGIRTRASFASESDWYRINQIGGRYLSIASSLIILSGVIGFFLPASLLDPYSIAAAVVSILAVLVPCIRLSRMKAHQ